MFILVLETSDYLSPQIINEIISLAGYDLLREIPARIHGATTWFTILADETSDIIKQQQISLSICLVSGEYEINEDLIVLVHVPDITADTLTPASKDVLICCNFPTLPMQRIRLKWGLQHDGTFERNN